MNSFFPTVFGWTPEDLDTRARCGLPTRHGGLAIPHPVELARQERDSSARLTDGLQKALLERADHFRVDTRSARLDREKRRRERDADLRTQADDLASRLTGRAARGFEEARLRGGSSWLSFVPLDELGLSMDRAPFRDAVALRMGRELPDPLPTTCPSCGSAFDIQHALDCKKGGWVVRRHNEIVRAWKRYFEKGGSRIVHVEPLLPPLPPGAVARPSTKTTPDARADLVEREPCGRDHYYDVACLDTGAPSHLAKATALKALEDYQDKKIAENEDRVTPYGAFTPLVCSVYGTLAPSASITAHRVARRVDPDRDEHDAVLDLHSAMMQAAVIKATSLCLRARSWSVLPPVDAAGSFEDASGRVRCARFRAV